MEQFEITLKDGTVRKGNAWSIKNAKANLAVITGMEETSARYDDFAKFLNAHGYSVFVLDQYGQGENVDDPSELGRWEKSGFRKTVNALDELITHLRITCRPIMVMGHSMGCLLYTSSIKIFSNLMNIPRINH